MEGCTLIEVTKVCSICGEELPLSAYPNDKRLKSGKSSRCKACKAAYRKLYYAANKSRENRQHREWHQANKALAKAYQQEWEEENKERRKQYRAGTSIAKKWVDANPEKYTAHKVYRAAIKSGKLVRASHCFQCGIECTPDGHHYDYSKPLSVVWLCRSCHRLLHNAETH